MRLKSPELIMIVMFLINNSVTIVLHRISIQVDRPTHPHPHQTVAHHQQYWYEKDFKIIRIDTVTEKQDAGIKNEAWAAYAQQK